MNNPSREIHMLCEKAQGSMNKTSQIQQALAKIEADVSRKENQKVTEKIQGG